MAFEMYQDSYLLFHKFFLIDTDTLLNLDPNGHSFNTDYYPELKNQG